MTRRPRSRLPPKLPDPIRERTASAPRPPSVRQQIKDTHVAGRSAEFGAAEVSAVMRRVARGEGGSLLGCTPFPDLTLSHVQDAVRCTYGWEGSVGRATISARATVEAFEGAVARVLEVAASGGRLAFATGAPASLFVVHRALADAAARAGGDVFEAVESGPIGDRGPRATRLRWLDRVAMTTDGMALAERAGPSRAAADELLFVAGPVDLVVADRTFAGRAVASGCEVVAFAGLDALALAVAAWRGMAIRVVPLDERRAPSCYAPLLDLVTATAHAT